MSLSAQQHCVRKNIGKFIASKSATPDRDHDRSVKLAKRRSASEAKKRLSSKKSKRKRPRSDELGRRFSHSKTRNDSRREIHYELIQTHEPELEAGLTQRSTNSARESMSVISC